MSLNADVSNMSEEDKDYFKSKFMHKNEFDQDVWGSGLMFFGIILGNVGIYEVTKENLGKVKRRVFTYCRIYGYDDEEKWMLDALDHAVGFRVNAAPMTDAAWKKRAFELLEYQYKETENWVKSGV